MSDEANPIVETTTVNVKGMPVDAWKTARTAAGKLDMTVGEWLAGAIALRAQHDAGQRVALPDERSASSANPVANPGAIPVKPPSLSPDEVESLARAMKVATEAAGLSVPKASARHVVALATQHMRAARGLTEPPPKPKNRKVLELAADSHAGSRENPRVIEG